MMRPVTDQDFDAIYEIYMDETVYPFTAYDIHNKEEFKPVFEQMKNRTHFFIFEDESGPYGMCTLLEDIGRARGSVYFGAYGIKSSKQGQGLGKKTFKQVESFAKNKGYKTMFFFVEGDNERGIAFYKAMGFEHTGGIPQYLKRENEDHYVDELIFAKILTD